MARSPRPGKPGHARSRAAASAPQGMPAQGIPVEQAIDLAYRHWEAGQFPEAETLCRQVLAVLPAQPDTHHLLGLMAHALGRLDLAIEHMRQACGQPMAPAAYFSNLGELCRRAGRLEEAERATRQAAARDWLAPGIWSNLGIILQEAGKLEDSARCLQRMLALAPDAPEGHNNLGNTLLLMERSGEAALRYGAALILNPLYADACSNLGKLTAALGQPEAGMALLRRALAINPRMADAYLNAAELEAGRGRWTDALNWLEALRDFAPDNPKLPGARAFIVDRLGRIAEAEAAAKGKPQ
ncbi:tetratricopeptide repeat protein [Azospirillum doebereinerae]|uniref:Tetratricopeptide repeat protein n=1 Tax=Azospirillum doebereinerae TaxID=92933 RepID=A0A433J3R9_9PROT|nr:tetratricopeptide repeat protein [Azospirillum doebereinerae]RUQ66502.1 tetratricopeptide repeat protein [Azospirillum doebereinerae]